LASTATRSTQPIALAADHSPPSVTTTTTTTTVAAEATPTAAVRRSPPPVPTTTTTSTSTTSTTTTTTTTPPLRHQTVGLASWYDTRTGYCASPYLSFGTVLPITDVATGVTIRCTVDDRQAVNRPRVVDLSYDGFAALGHPSIGLIEVRLTW
jgi:rare lipoprotein A (peptidoglycan hydrolase)